MSLINDALKRASGPRRTPRPSLEGMQPADIRSEAAPESNHKIAVAVLVLSMVGGLILATVAYLSRKEVKMEIGAFKRPRAALTNSAHAGATNTVRPGLSNPVARAAAVLQGVAQQNADGESVAASIQAAPTPPPAKPVAPEASKPASNPPPAVVAVPAPAAVPTPAPSRTPAPVPSSAATPVPAQPVTPATATASAAFPALRLQAIYFRLKAPTALINGKTVSVGETIEGVKVTQILRQSVRVALNSDVRELRLR